MPSIDGGDQMSPDYAPWAWLGPNNEYMIWQSEKKFQLGEWIYRAGRTSDEQLVCERFLASAESGLHVRSDSVAELVDIADIPAELVQLMEDVSFSGQKAKVSAAIAQLQFDAPAQLEAQLAKARSLVPEPGNDWQESAALAFENAVPRVSIEELIALGCAKLTRSNDAIRVYYQLTTLCPECQAKLDAITKYDLVVMVRHLQRRLEYRSVLLHKAADASS